MKRAIFPGLLVASVRCMSCASTIPTGLRPMRLSELRNPDQPPRLPLLFEFHPGEEIPMRATVDGDFIETRPSAPLMLVVKRHFFLFVSKDAPPRISLDGRTLGEVAGALSVGVGNEKAQGPSASFGLALKQK